MTNQNFSQRNKSFRKLFLKSNITFSNNPINRLIGVQPENDKKILLKKLKDKISTISECKLKNNSNNIVFNDGNINSPIMLIGEAPGQKEDELSKPFVGEAGSLLNKMLSAINLNRKDLYITNVVNYRPPLNRKPDSNEIKRYSEFLLEHVYIIKPKIIIFDEPSTGLDTRASHKLDHLIRDSVKNKNITAITITHDMNSALQIADTIAMLQGGKLIWSGKSSELKKSNHAEVKHFIKPFATSA